MFKESIMHLEYDPYRFFLSPTQVVIRLRIDKRDYAAVVNLVYKSTNLRDHEYKRSVMSLRFEDDMFVYLDVTVNVAEGNMNYFFEIKKGKNMYYLLEDGLTDKLDPFYHFCTFQIPHIHIGDVFNTNIFNMEKAIVYYLHLETFVKQQVSKKRKVTDVYTHSDFQGIIDRLPYLKQLGVNKIIVAGSNIYTGSHTNDFNAYYNIDKRNKADKDLAYLIKKVKEQDFAISIEISTDHLHIRHPIFQDVVKKGYKSKYYDWFIVYGDKVDLNVCNYETFNNRKNYPKLNVSNPEVLKFFGDMVKYLISTYNIDALKLSNLRGTSHAFMRSLLAAKKQVNRSVALIATSYNDNLLYFDGTHFDVAVNYTLTKLLEKYFIDNSINVQEFSDRLNFHLFYYADSIYEMMLNVLSRQGEARWMDLCDGDVDKYLLSFGFLFSFMGTPVIRYGDEIGLRNKTDQSYEYMRWEEVDESSIIFRTFQELSKIKKTYFSKYKKIYIRCQDNMLILERRGLRENIMCAFTNQEAELDVGVRDVIYSRNFKDGKINNGFVIYKLQPEVQIVKKLGGG